MKCPRCKLDLKEINYEGIKIDTCEKCEGEWLDHGEITHIREVEDKVFSQEEKAKVQGIHRPVVTKNEQPQFPLMCPHCNTPLSTFNYAYSTGVIIDRCNNCQGAWFDKDEIEHIQIIAEEHKKSLPELEAKFAPVLARVKEETQQRIEENPTGVNYNLIKNPIASAITHAILFHIFD